MRKLLLIAVAGLALAMTARGAVAQQDQDNDMSPPPAGTVADNEMRFEQLNDQMRELTGRVEELQHNVDTLRARIERMSGDVDMRLRALEGGSSAAGPSATGPATGMTEPQAEVQPPTPAPRNRTAGLPPTPPGGKNQPPGNQTAMAQPGGAVDGSLPSGSPQQQYDFAFGLLRDGNYPAAERALRDFVHRYPDSRLSSNAQYWLGETYYVRRNFQAAAAAFAEGYQRYPRGAKAADDLLKLGSSLAMLNRRADACRAFAQLDRDFPIAPANLKAKETEEKRKAGCR